jgi:hypothetical protein
LRAVAILVGVCLAQGALACGYCVEDKIAAAYDHGVVVRAVDARHKVVFLSVEGAPAGSQGRALVRVVETTAGVDAGTVRVSLEGGAVSFAYDPSRSLGPIINSIEKKFAAKGAGVSLLRVVGD